MKDLCALIQGAKRLTTRPATGAAAVGAVEKETDSRNDTLSALCRDQHQVIGNAASIPALPCLARKRISVGEQNECNLRFGCIRLFPQLHFKKVCSRRPFPVEHAFVFGKFQKSFQGPL